VVAVEGSHDRFDCELRYSGVCGVETQFFRDGEFVAGRRFGTRALAVWWAEEERKVIEKGEWAMKGGPSNGERESWELQRQRERREELKSLIEEADSLGLDGNGIAARAPELYKDMTHLPKPFKGGLGRPLLDADVRSELDHTKKVLKTAIRKAKALNAQTDPTRP
jgi:hypothetical protein